MSALVAAARRHLGVRFRHRGRSPRGLDCAGLAWLAYHDCGVTLPDFRLYGTEPAEDGLVRHMIAAVGAPLYVGPVPPAALRPGDVAVFRFEIEPHHVALLGDYRFGGLSVIHACGHNGRVIEQRLTDDMTQRITHVFRRPV
jgi:cell wall-associated NlpC family hydrolase